MERVP